MKMDSAGRAENVVSENSGRDEPSDLDVENLTHEELLEITRRTVNDIVAADRFLKVLPQDVTLDEVNSAIAVHYGQSITILVERNDDVTLSVTVPQRDSTVLDLKKRIKTTMMLYLRRHKIDTKVSWRYIWRTYSLSFNGVKLNDDRAQLHKLGIVHHSTVKFVKKLRVKTPLIND
nr:PREDICTED: U11/U12 small nuclear ribonucleoprotein 25 kDa protein-like [Bemisia tabaci]